MISAAFTIITSDYLPYARVLAASFLAHHPDARFLVLSLDALPDGEAVHERAEILRPADLDLPQYGEMAAHYKPLELCCALKPSVALTVLDRAGGNVVYFDSDILVMAPLVPVDAALSEGDVAITPHVVDPIEPDGLQPDELDVLKGGVYNMGFFAVRASDEARRFLRWWERRLRDGARIDIPRGLFLDQRWVDLAPVYFPSTRILRDPTCNVASWNLHERPLTKREDGAFIIGGRPVTFFHFSGVDLQRRAFRVDWKNRFAMVPGSPVEELVAEYSARNVACGYVEEPLPRRRVVVKRSFARRVWNKLRRLAVSRLSRERT